MSSFRVATIRGVAIEVHWSWLLIFGVLSWMLATSYYPDQYDGWSGAAYWFVGIGSAFLLFVTVLIHEMAHALVALRRGLPVPRITLFIFGGVSHLARQPRSAGEEFKIAAAGPATSLVLALVTGLGAWLAVDRQIHTEATLTYLAVVNAMLAIFNTLPGFPLDGGRVLRSIAWRRTKSFRQATRFAAFTGQGVGFVMMVGGGILLLVGSLFQGIWLILIGWFLVGAARGEIESLQVETILRDLSARDVMRENWPTATPGTPVSVLVDEMMIGQGERAVIVALGGAVQGILTVNDVRRIPRHQWSEIPAQTVMTRREDVTTVGLTTPAFQVMMMMAEEGLNQIPVIEDGRMVGLISRRELIDRLRLAESLTPDKAPDGS
ncbi:MAG TPA: site-2 protease family protein [Dehalococcoidia bacterium]|jgi:Zn-dependent protease|nr:site-2 protease family protein [Dehalococcoidia bacterium]